MMKHHQDHQDIDIIDIMIHRITMRKMMAMAQEADILLTGTIIIIIVLEIIIFARIFQIIDLNKILKKILPQDIILANQTGRH